MAKLTGRGVEVVGVSGDTVRTHALFKAAQGLPFALLADPDRVAARLFGVPLTGAGQVKTRGVPGGEVVEREVTASR